MSECVLADCENGILHEYDCNDSFGNHTTGVIYCPMCHPEQYEPDSDPLIAAAPEMYELISDVSQAYDDSQSGHELASRLYDLRCMALRLLAKIEGGGDG